MRNDYPASHVVIATWTHNGEKTIKRAIDSILNQTYGNFTYYIIDNECTDSTPEIIKAYAKADPRIRLLKRDKNALNLLLFDWAINSIDINYDYFAVLDDDDEYKPDFLEKILTFAEHNDLDIAHCGWNIFKWNNQLSMYVFNNIKAIANDLIVNNSDEFDLSYPTYREFAVSMCGAVYRSSILKKADLKTHPHNDLVQGSDGLFNALVYKNAEKAGVMAKSLFNRYERFDSITFKITHKRLQQCQILHDAWYEFLITKCGFVSQRNLEFMYNRYEMYMKYIASIIMSVDDDVAVKQKYVTELLQNELAHMFVDVVLNHITNMTTKNI